MLSDEEKKAIDYFKVDVEYLEEELKNPNYIGRFITIQDKEFKYLKTILNLIEKQDKIINEMADRLEFVMKNSGIGLDSEHGMNFTINDIKEYFEKKVEEN